MSLLSHKGGEWERKERRVERWRLFLRTGVEEVAGNEYASTPMYPVSSLHRDIRSPAIHLSSFFMVIITDYFCTCNIFIFI
jgi:hypothetical protein